MPLLPLGAARGATRVTFCGTLRPTHSIKVSLVPIQVLGPEPRGGPCTRC
jgi:hypothetical protein